MRVLVTGATGNVGSQVTPRLLERGHTVRVLTRSPYKLKKLAGRVEVAEGSLDDAGCLKEACRDVDAMFLLTPVVEKDEMQHGLNGVEAAKAAGVKRIVFMTVHRVEEAPQVPHFGAKIPVKEAIRASGLEYTFIEPSSFFQTDLWIEDPLRMFGIYPQPLGSVGVSRVDTGDIADAAVTTLTSDGHNGETYALAGPDALTGEDCARIWTKHLGTEVQYIGDDLDNWESQASMMMPPWMAHHLRIMYEHFHKSGCVATEEELERLEKLLGREPRRFDDFVASVAPNWI
jgi:uncharacterized protein YbjT (DUF2867 family)